MIFTRFMHQIIQTKILLHSFHVLNQNWLELHSKNESHYGRSILTMALSHSFSSIKIFVYFSFLFNNNNHYLTTIEWRYQAKVDRSFLCFYFIKVMTKNPTCTTQLCIENLRSKKAINVNIITVACPLQ